jgi:hypothetical protein
VKALFIWLPFISSFVVSLVILFNSYALSARYSDWVHGSAFHIRCPAARLQRALQGQPVACSRRRRLGARLGIDVCPPQARIIASLRTNMGSSPCHPAKRYELTAQGSRANALMCCSAKAKGARGMTCARMRSDVEMNSAQNDGSASSVTTFGLFMSSSWQVNGSRPICQTYSQARK